MVNELGSSEVNMEKFKVFLLALSISAVTCDPITEELLNKINNVNEQTNSESELNPKIFGFFESEPEPVKADKHLSDKLEALKDMINKPIEHLRDKFEHKHEIVKPSEDIHHKNEAVNAVVSSVANALQKPGHHMPLHHTEHYDEPNILDKIDAVKQTISNSLHEVQKPFVEVIPTGEPYTNEFHGLHHNVEPQHFEHLPIHHSEEKPFLDKIKGPVDKIVNAAANVINNIKNEVVPNKVAQIADKIDHTISKPVENIKKPIINAINKVQSIKNDIEHVNDKYYHQKPSHHDAVQADIVPGLHYYSYPQSSVAYANYPGYYHNYYSGYYPYYSSVRYPGYPYYNNYYGYNNYYRHVY